MSLWIWLIVVTGAAVGLLVHRVISLTAETGEVFSRVADLEERFETVEENVRMIADHLGVDPDDLWDLDL